MMCRSTLTLPWQPGFDSHEIVKELMNSPDYTVRDSYYSITTSVTILQYYELLKIESLDNAILEL